MRVTVAICTWNRAQLLRQTLERMTQLSMPPAIEWELLVVNNGCTDDTDAVLTAYAGRLPMCRLCEPRPGLSNARNRAVQEATGQYILWTDDDVLVDERWLAAYCEAFARWPEAALFGGPITLEFAGSPPVWLRQILPRIAVLYAARDLGSQPSLLSVAGNRMPFGANFAVRARELRGHRFRPELGRYPNRSGLGCEETELLEELLCAGATGMWVPDAGVRHRVTPERQTIRYLRDQFEAYGEYVARRASRAGRQPKERPPDLWRMAVAAEFRYRFHRLVARPERWIEDLAAASEARGQLRGLTDWHGNA